MRIREADNIQQFESIAKEYYGDKLSKIHQEEAGGIKQIKMEKDLGRESQILKMCYKAKIAFYNVKSVFYDCKLALYNEITNLLSRCGVKNALLQERAEAAVDQSLANVDRNVAIVDLANAKINKRIVTIVLKDSVMGQEAIRRISNVLHTLKLNSAKSSPEERLEACLSLAGNCIDIGEYIDAEKWLSMASDLEKKNPTTNEQKKELAKNYVQLATAYESRVLTYDHNYSKIYELYAKAVDYNPKDSVSLLKLGNFNIRGKTEKGEGIYNGIEKNYTKAVDYFCQAIDLDKEAVNAKKVVKEITEPFLTWGLVYGDTQKELKQLLEKIKDRITNEALKKEVEAEITLIDKY